MSTKLVDDYNGLIKKNLCNREVVANFSFSENSVEFFWDSFFFYIITIELKLCCLEYLAEQIYVCFALCARFGVLFELALLFAQPISTIRWDVRI